MGTTVVPSSMKVSIPQGDQKDDGFIGGPNPKDLDAGALFVLKSRGSWWHCGYHLTTSIVAPVLLSLPFAMSLLGWAGGTVCLALGAVVTFYSYNLLSLVLEWQAHLGQRQLRFRDMARDILGPAWGKYFVGPLQFAICYGAVVACTLLGGQSLKFIYLLYKPDGKMQLYQFISMFGGLTLFLAQVPSFHSLRHINLVSLVLCLAYSACALGGSIDVGNSVSAPPKDYSLVGSRVDRLFGVFNGISIIATTYGSGIIPEIQVLQSTARFNHLLGNSSSSGEGQDVQGPVRMLFGRSDHIFQRWNLWVLGVWESIQRNYSHQFHGRDQATPSHLVPIDDQYFLPPPNISCHCGIYATDQRNFGEETGGPEDGPVLDTQCRAQADRTVAVGGGGDHDRRDAALLRGHHGADRRVRSRPPGLHIAHDFL
ncbi:GABA transporter 1 isoform X2 [Eucalyptus grandis]|uniref:GABA transporter 1 isoform X2 n=1 Tax=Eucalyptus grandis TaxID=71139 RepID=UPI00192EA1BA|nr:GABA transporter 1 isoform X2 [Eucalyptus grandis]